MRSYITDEEFCEYSRLVQKGEAYEGQFKELIASDNYQRISGLIDTLRERMNANDIYVAYVDVDVIRSYKGIKEGWNPILYMFDSYKDEKLRYYLGDVGPCNPDFNEDVIKFMKTGERPDNYFLSHSDYGYNTSAIMPVMFDGTTIAVIGVEIPMVTLQSALREYVTHTVFATIAIVLVFIIVYMTCLLYTSPSPRDS